LGCNVIVVEDSVCLPSVCCHCVKHICGYNIAGIGLHWSNINRLSSDDDNFTMFHTLVILAIDIIFYTIITWYFDALLPGDYGTPQPFYFPFTVFVRIVPCEIMAARQLAGRQAIMIYR